MFVINLTPPEVALLAAGFGSLLALLFLWRAHGRLRAEIAAVARRAYPPDVAYQRFSVSYASLTRWFLLITLVVAAVGAVANLQPPAGEQGLSPDIWAIAFGAIASFFLPLVVYDLLAVPLVALAALRQLRGLTIDAAEIVGLRLKRDVLVFLPLVALGLAGLLFPGLGPLLGLLTAALLAYFVVLGLFGAHVLRWQVRTAPLERTEWAALASRIAEWQRRTGGRWRDVRIQYTGRLGYANVQVAGALDRTLFISDAFLAESDWRQRDALVAWAIGYTRRASARAGSRLAIYALVTVAVACAILLAQLAPDLDPVAFAAFPLAFLLLALALLASRRGRAAGTVAAADRFAAGLTGDPLAVIVALNTLNALNAVAPQRAAGRYPSLASRVLALDALARQPGYRAPYAAQPVPSAVPVAVNGQSVTVPLDQTPPPAPVPAAPSMSVVPPMSVPTRAL